MKKETKEEQKKIANKLNKINLDLENIPKLFKIKEKIAYKPLQEYDNTNYKIYRYVNVKDIEIYLTPTTRLDETAKKYKLAQPLINYLQPKNKELKENYEEFTELLENLDEERLEQIEREQKILQDKEPFSVKYRDNFIWGIYYSELKDKYFMMFPTKETQTEALFFLIKKQIELQKSKKSEMIYVPINNTEYTSSLLRKSEIADLENYLWYFTKDWPTIYEIQEQNGKKELKIVGTVNVYNSIKSIYKICLTSKEEAQQEYKLIKALFILASNAEEEYSFQTGLDEKSRLCFYYNHTQIKYDNLVEFITNEVKNKKQKIVALKNQNLVNEEKLQLLKNVIANQNIEYLGKEKQIVTFLECKKSFFGRINYFFKSNKKKKKTVTEEKPEEKQEEKPEERPVEFKEKEFYTIEDLVKICTILQKEEKEFKNKELDIKALENKRENLETKIKNATIYINEIESHKKSIFDFWKFTNKDEKPLLTESEIEEEQNKEKIKKVFSYEEDIESVGKRIDKAQRDILSEKECDAIFAIYNDVETFNIDKKEKKLKKDTTFIEKRLKTLQKEYKKDYEEIEDKDFDIFGLVDDKTKIKTLNSQKHREIAKDKYKILEIHPNTTVDEYRDNIHHYGMLLSEAYNEMTSPYDMKIYKVDKTEIKDKNWIIMNMNANAEIKKCYNEKSDNFVFNCINLKENMHALFYSNIMFYYNLNDTLPEGMDESQCVLLDLSKFEIKLVGRKDFNINVLKNEYENEIKQVHVYEYDINEIKEKKDEEDEE